LNWSEPLSINNVEVAQFAANTPMYVYPANTIKNMGVVNGHPTGRLGLMYYHDATWGSYNVTPTVGANDGGAVKFMSIDIDMSSLIASGIGGVITRSDTQQPLPGILVTAGTASATSNAQGVYNLSLLPGTYDVTASGTVYATANFPDVEVNAGMTTDLDIVMTPGVRVYGVVRSTNPNVGLAGATFTLTGVHMYEAVTDSLGLFSIEGVQTNQIYLYVVVREGYNMVTGTVHVLGNNYNLGNIYMQPSPNDDETDGIFINKLLGANPNPFMGSTSITYTLKNPAPVILDIYNVRGQLVRTLQKADSGRGEDWISWDGKDNKGHSLAAGLYFIRMQTDSYTGQQKLLLLK